MIHDVVNTDSEAEAAAHRALSARVSGPLTLDRVIDGCWVSDGDSAAVADFYRAVEPLQLKDLPKPSEINLALRLRRSPVTVTESRIAALLTAPVAALQHPDLETNLPELDEQQWRQVATAAEAATSGGISLSMQRDSLTEIARTTHFMQRSVPPALARMAAKASRIAGDRP